MQVESLANNVSSYSEYLSSQNRAMKISHAKSTPVRQLSDSLAIKFIHPCCGVPEKDLGMALEEEQCAYKYVSLNDFTPDESRKRYNFIRNLEQTGLSVPCMLLMHSSGNNSGNLHFIWRLPLTDSIEECFQKSLSVIEQIKPHLLVFHTRAMRKAMFEKFGRISPAVKPAVLRHIYRALTGDSSASNNMQEVEIDERVLQIVSMEPEDPNTIVDLREVKHSETRSKFEVFWGEAQKFINEDLGVAVDDRRHNEVHG